SRGQPLRNPPSRVRSQSAQADFAACCPRLQSPGHAPQGIRRYRMVKQATELRVGSARMVVTPPLGVSLAGSYSDRRADGVRDDLYARALVIEDGATPVAIVSVDILGVSAATTAGSRRLVERLCGIPGDQVLIAATHNHSGPLTRELDAGGRAGERDE